MKLRYKILIVIGCVVAALAIFGAVLWRHDMSPANAGMGEYLEPNESVLTAQIISSAIGLSVESRDALIQQAANPKADPPAPDNATADPGYKPTTYIRDVHSKSHGCVLANFSVNTVPTRFAQGVFAQPATYHGIIRFSSGQPGVHSDSEKDAQGMAIKLLDVPGQKLLTDDGGVDPGQDFIMMNSPVFFIRTLPEYEAFSRALGNNDILGYFMPSVWHPLGWHLREMYLAEGTRKPRPRSVVTTRYWSASAYALGPRYVKYSAKPCAGNAPLLPASNTDPDYLRLELAKQAAQGNACFDFMVQPQVAGKDMPVEDTTVNWSEKDSPFVPVARITIPAQTNNTEAMNNRCEDLEFNPWHTRAADRPVGVMNRVREALYQAMARFRRGKNGVTAPGN